jgi:inward rectifier potassium channel
MQRWYRARSGSPQLGDAMRAARSLRIRPIGGGRWHPSDIYHQLLRMSWRALTAMFVASFIVFNLLFAVAYSRDPTGIYWGEHPVNGPLLLRDFFFSVQTVATIGYGNMYPVSLYANVVVVFEITLGILFFALVTGIVFARFSRPTARVLFSNIAVVTDVEGTPTLMFRAANLRHNLVFEARATVSVLMDETVGGVDMRRFKDLKLVRDANPVFTLSWMIMHPIDGDSPLAHWVPGKEAPDNSEIIVVLSGIDDRTGQTIHGRWAYASSDIRWHAKFVDIIGTLPDGTRTIDYRRFHEISAEEPRSHQ